MYGNHGMAGIFMAPMGLIGILVVILLAFGIFALVKYLRS